MEKYSYILMVSFLTAFGFVFFYTKRNWFSKCKKSPSKIGKKIAYHLFHFETMGRKLGSILPELGSNLILTSLFSKISGVHWFFSFENAMFILSLVFIFKICFMLIIYSKFFDTETTTK